MSIDIAALQTQAEHAFNAGDINTVVRNARQILAAEPEHAPAHLMLAGVALVFALLIATPLGIFAGLYPDRWPSSVALTALRG